MPFDLIPRSFFGPSRWQNWLDPDGEDWASFLPSSGLTISEDDKNVYVEAAVPGIDPDKVEMTYDKGVLWIRGNDMNEQKEDGKKYYRKASSSFSYRVAIPGDIDVATEPQASYENGVMKVVFTKSPQMQPKKIQIKKQ